MTSCFKTFRHSFYNRIFGSQATNFPAVLLRIHILVLNTSEQWLGEMQNLSAKSSFKSPRRCLIKASKNSSFICNFLFFFVPVDFRVRLILVLFILYVPRQYTISLVQGSINPNKLFNRY